MIRHLAAGALAAAGLAWLASWLAFRVTGHLDPRDAPFEWPAL